MFITQANTPVKMPIAARMVEYGVLKLIVLKRAKTIDGAMSLIATMHSIISANKNMKATITAFVDVGFFKLHINKTQLIPDATIARKISTCVSNMKALKNIFCVNL